MNYRQDVVVLLLENGAHIDSRNKNNVRPLDSLMALPNCHVAPLKFMSLKCLAAAAVSKYNLPYKNEIPMELDEMVESH